MQALSYRRADCSSFKCNGAAACSLQCSSKLRQAHVVSATQSRSGEFETYVLDLQRRITAEAEQLEQDMGGTQQFHIDRCIWPLHCSIFYGRLTQFLPAKLFSQVLKAIRINACCGRKNPCLSPCSTRAARDSSCCTLSPCSKRTPTPSMPPVRKRGAPTPHPASIRARRWQRDSGDPHAGYGITAVLTGGKLLEKAAANVSVVRGTLSAERAAAMSARGRGSVDRMGGQAYSAVAMSLVFHSASPAVPTLRADVRLFEVLTHPHHSFIWVLRPGSMLDTSVSSSSHRLLQGTWRQRPECLHQQTVHSSCRVRMTCMHRSSACAQVGEDAWYGGGCDLTPNYLSFAPSATDESSDDRLEDGDTPDKAASLDLREDIHEFHQFWRQLCERHGGGLYQKYKAWCDECGSLSQCLLQHSSTRAQVAAGQHTCSANLCTL